MTIVSLVFLSLTTLFTFARADSLTLYVIHSPKHFLNWSSPRSLVRSTVINQPLSLFFGKAETDESFGKTMAEVKCSNEHFIVGATGHSDKARIIGDLLWRGYGLGIMFQRTSDGKLNENSAELKQEIVESINNKSARWIKWQISPSTCERLSAYHNDLVSKKFSHYFGFNLNPRKEEGVGRSTLALSFVEVAGVLDARTERSWKHTLKIADRLIGDPQNERFVRFDDLLMARHWSNKSDPAQIVTFWIPVSFLTGSAKYTTMKSVITLLRRENFTEQKFL